MESSGGEQTISPEFLQNIQSAVNSQGVLGQVQVIQTENGPITVLFMEEGADASGIMGDNLTVTIPEGGDGVSETVIQDGNSEVQYQFVESGDDYSHMVSEGVAGISGLEESVVSTGTDQNLGEDQTVVDSVNVVGTEADLTGIQSIVDSSVTTVSGTGLSGIQTVADIPVEQVSAEALQQAGESTDTYYITDSGQILKIDTSALNLGSSDTLQLLQGEDNTLQVINQGQTVQVVSQGESVEPQRPTETQISYVNVASDTASSSFGTSPNFEYTATRVDNQLVIDTRVEEPKVLSYKTTNRQRTNIMRQPVKSASQSLLSRSNIVTPGKAAAGYKTHGFKTVKETDAHGNTTEVLYPSTSKQKIIIPKLSNQTAYTSVISKGKSVYQPHQMITTMTKPHLMKSDATQTMVSKLSGTQYITMKQPASTGTVVYPKKPVVTPVVGRSQVVQSPAVSKSAAADLLSVAMKHADVDHPQSVTISPAVSRTSVLADSVINSSIAVQQPTSVATTSMSEQQSLSIAQEVLASGLQQLSEVSAASAPTTLEMQDDAAQSSTSSDQQHLIPNGELVTDQIKTETPAVGVSSVGTDVDQDFFGFESAEPGEDHSNEEQSVKQETSNIEAKKDVEPKQSAVSSNVEDSVSKKPVKAPEPETPKSVQIKSIDVPDSDVTIQLYADGTLVTRDKSGTNCSQVKLEELGLDMSMLEGNTDIELLIVQGDGKEVRATINTSMHVNPATDSVTKTTETAASNSVASKTAGNLTTPSGVTTKTTATSGSKVSQSVEGAPINEARPYKCSMCPRTFKFYRTYRCHEIVHTKAVTFTCHLCQRLFAREVNLQSHLELHKKKGMMKPVEKKQEEVGKNEYRCDECDRLFSAKNGLSRHMREVHHNETVPCPICGKLFASEKSLKKHSSQHVGPFTCPHCKNVFEQDVEYQEHIKAEHPEEIYTCAMCEFVVSSKVAYSNHIKLRHAHVEDLTPFIKDKECCICYSKFETQEQIEKHMNIHKTEKDHTCPACNRTYKQMWKLEQHIRDSHENGVTFKCTECEDTFGYKGKLDIHMKLFHRGPYQCYTCYEKFPGRNDMEEHQYKDHDIALTCSKCSLIVETSLKLKQHLKEHTSRNYICSSCDAGFEHKSSLKSHLVDKHFAGLKANMLKENPSMCNVNFEVVCDMCGEYFAGRSLYKQHLRDIHFGGDSVIMLELFPSLVKVQDIPDPVSCDHCGKTFLAVHHLNFHMRTHMLKTKRKRKSRAKNSAKERDSEPEDEEDEEVDFTNIEPRETDRQYKCEKCDAEFSRKAALEKHIANRHTKDVLKEALKNIEMEEIERAELEENEGVESTTLSEETPQDDEGLGEGTPDGMTPNLGKIKFPAPKTQPKTIFGTKITDGIEIDEKNLKCITCGKTYSQLKNLRKHVTNIHRKKLIKQRTFESSPALNDDGTTQCRKCNKRFDELANLRRHMVQKHRIYLQRDGVESLTKSPSKKIKSEESDEDFEPMDTSLEAGDNSSGDISSFLGMNFNLGKTHSCNIESVKMKQHRCNLCGIRFSREATLKKHLLLHKSSETDTKLDIEDPSDLLPAKYPCKSCGNMYSTAIGLIHHNRSKHADVDELNVLADIDAVDEKTKEESPKKKPTDKKPSKSLKRKLSLDGDELREVAKKKVKVDKEGKESYECKICGSIYYTFKGLSNHERDIHGTKKTPVSPTVRTSMSGRILTKSTRLSEYVSCDHCSKTFSEEKHLKLHILRMHNAEVDKDESVTPSGKGSKLVYHCDVCEQRFSTMSNLNHHMVSVHDENEDTGDVKKEDVTCDVCNLEFATEKTLAVHKRKHTGEKPYNCCLCNKRFISKYQLECHMKKLHAKLWVRKVKCKICLMLFETETAMLNHKEVHKKSASEEEEEALEEEEEQSLHECDLCDKAFKWKRNLTSHVETHHKEEDPLTCGVCNKVFPDKASIKKHMVEHQSKKKAYACDQCDKSFPKEVSLKMHISHMHKSTPGGLSCDICKETFTVKLKLMEHMLIHTSVMPHKCSVCSASFKQEFRLKAHMLTHKANQKKNEKVVQTEEDNEDAESENKDGDKDAKPSKTTSGGKFKCKRCGKRFQQMVLVKIHIAKAHKSTKTAALPAPVKVGTRSRSTSTSTTASTTESKPESKKKSAKQPDKETVSKDSKSSASFKSPKISSANKDTKSSSTVKSSKKSLAEKDAKSSPALKSTKSSSATKDSKSSPATTHFCKKCKKNFLKADTYKLHMKVMHGQTIEDKHSKDGKEKSDKDQKRTVIMTMKAKELKGKSDKAEIKRKKEKISVKVTSTNNCPICKKSFDSRAGLKIHLKIKHKVTIEASPTKSDGHRKKCLYCSDCARVFWSQLQYDTHNKKYHPDKSAVELDRQVMEAMRGVKPEPVDATSPKAADFETIKHKCEFCAQVHYTKKLFDQHMLKEHPEHAAEYGISESRTSSKKAPKNLLSVGLYGADVHNQLSASPVVSLQRMHKSFKKGSSDDSYELEFQKFLESEQLSDISDEMPEDLTGDSDIEADSKGGKAGKSGATKVASEDNDDLIMEIEEEVEDSGKEGKQVEEKSDDTVEDTVEKVNQISGGNKTGVDDEVNGDSENNGIEIVETFSLATSHMEPVVNEENQPVTEHEETESGQNINEQTIAVNLNTDDQDQSLNVETTPGKGIARADMEVSKEQENIDWAAIDNEIEAVGDSVIKPDDSLVSTSAIESSIERTGADTDVSGIESVLHEDNEEVTGSYEEMEKDAFALQESISGSTATNAGTAGTSQEEGSVESLDLNEAEYFQGSVEKGADEIITASNNNEIQTQDSENYSEVLPSSNGGENLDLDLVEVKNNVYNELDKWDEVKKSVGTVDEQNVLETENVEGLSEDLVATSEVYFEDMETS